MFKIIETDIGEESQSPGVHAKNRDVFIPNTTGCLQKRSVAPHREHEVGIEIITREYLGGIYLQMLVVLQILVVFAVDIQLCAKLVERGEHLLNRGRLLRLVDIAKKGKSLLLMFHTLTIVAAKVTKKR